MSQNEVQQWNDFFPDFLLQMWGALQKYKDDEDISSFYYSDFEFPVEQVSIFDLIQYNILIIFT